MNTFAHRARSLVLVLAVKPLVAVLLLDARSHRLPDGQIDFGARVHDSLHDAANVRDEAV